MFGNHTGNISRYVRQCRQICITVRTPQTVKMHYICIRRDQVFKISKTWVVDILPAGTPLNPACKPPGPGNTALVWNLYYILDISIFFTNIQRRFVAFVEKTLMERNNTALGAASKVRSVYNSDFQAVSQGSI